MQDLDYYSLPRLFIAQDLAEGASISLDTAHHHYLIHVLRSSTGDELRIFNDKNGEFMAKISKIHKKNVILDIKSQISLYKEPENRIHLIFSPIKKNRLAFLIEKCVELGVSDFHPVVMDRTAHKMPKTERTEAQIIEALEQCERMALPVLHPMVSLQEKVKHWDAPIFWAAERLGAEPSTAPYTPEDFAVHDVTALIGPEGGFSDREKQILWGLDIISPISLGSTIYRSETAALVLLARLRGLHFGHAP